jgi:hypothetical protein
MRTREGRDPAVAYREFQQACRAYRPSDLLPALAAASISVGNPPFKNQVLQRFPPWGLAAAARESLLHGNEYRDKPVTPAELVRLMNKFKVTDGPPEEPPYDDQFLVRTFTRIIYEQFPYQESLFEEVARPHALIIEGLDDVATQVISEATLHSMLDGMSLREAIGATFFIQVGANESGGRYDPSIVERTDLDEIFEIYPANHIAKIAARLTTTVEEYRQNFAERTHGDPKLARYDYNPLAATPIVQLADGLPVAPVPNLILRTVSPLGLYYLGVKAHGNAFAEDLGLLFEHYIGRQLRLLDEAEVHPEVIYNRSGGQKKSVDWLVIFEDLVLLVEVKSRRLGPGQQAGTPSLFGTLEETLTHSRRQLERTIEAMADGVPEFAHIPTDRQILGVIVTAEPFHTGAAYMLDHDVATISNPTLGDIPVAVASARDIEMLMTHGSEVEQVVLHEIATRGTGTVGFNLIGTKDDLDNPILAHAWNSYPWPSPSDHTI